MLNVASVVEPVAWPDQCGAVRRSRVRERPLRAASWLKHPVWANLRSFEWTGRVHSVADTLSLRTSVWLDPDGQLGQQRRLGSTRSIEPALVPEPTPGGRWRLASERRVSGREMRPRLAARRRSSHHRLLHNDRDEPQLACRPPATNDP